MKRRRYLIDDSAYPVFITTTVVNWIPVFSINQIASDALTKFENLRAEFNMTVNGFVLMPNHFHAILQSETKGDVSRLIQKWKSLTSKQIVKFCSLERPEWLKAFADSAKKFKMTSKQQYQVWIPRFDDYAIRDENAFLTKLNYIHGNPLKHGLADDCEDFPYSSFSDYQGKKNGHVTIICGQGKP